MVAKVVMITLASAAVAAATYYGLETAYPQKKSDGDGNATGDVEAVFAGKIDSAATTDSHAVAAMGSAVDTSDNTAAESTAPAEVAAAGEVSPADEAGMPEPAAEAALDPTAEPTAEPTPEPTAEPTPKPTPAPTAAPEPVEKAPSTDARRHASKPAAKPKPVLTSWWGAPSEQRLSVVYAGSAAYTRAIVLMFNGEFDNAAQAAAHLGVTDANGKAVAGSWQVGASNKRMLLFPVSSNGIYNVSIDAGLADRSGRVIGSVQQGPVQVQ